MRLIDADALQYSDARDMLPTGQYITREEIDKAAEPAKRTTKRTKEPPKEPKEQLKEPTRRGHWEWNDYGGFGNYHCSVCKYIPYGKFSRKFHPNYMYCPRCGAKMDEVST